MYIPTILVQSTPKQEFKSCEIEEGLAKARITPAIKRTRDQTTKM